MKTKKTLISTLTLTFGWLVQSQALSAATLYTTTEDFTQFAGGAGVTSTTFYSESGTINGIGNALAPGGTGTAGSAALTADNGFGYVTGGQFSGPTAAAFQALSPGSLRPYSAESGFNPGTMLASSGTFTLDIQSTNVTGYSYFQFGILLNYNNNYATFTPTSSTSFTGDDGAAWTRYEIPYTTAATSLTYFQWGLFRNSGGGTGGATLYLDNVQVQAVPEPSVSILLGGCALLGTFRRRR